MKATTRFFACDFETTVYEGQTETEVWLAGYCELFTEDINIFYNIDDMFISLINLKENVIIYFHNLKFDGEFIISYLLKKGFTQAIYQYSANEFDVKFYKRSQMSSNTFSYSISDKGLFYTILIKTRKNYIEIRDSLKLLPIKLRILGESFGTKHKKLEMRYEGYRYAGCEVKEEEKEYFKNDIFLLKEALEIMYEEGHKDLTIGSCCLKEYKLLCRRGFFLPMSYDECFPNLYDYYLDLPNGISIGTYIRNSYKGGWCYLVKGKENKIFVDGVTADVNSLYPSMMESTSGNVYPIGLPRKWVGNYIPEEATKENKYFFVRIKTRFYLKNGYLPFIQIKNTLLYNGRDHLETSDILVNGKFVKNVVQLTLTCTDYYLFLEHYNVEDFEILDGFIFYAIKGLFDEYLNKYKKIKMESKGARREISKFFQNNLYGKFATSTDSSFKVARMLDGVVNYFTVKESEKKPGYIPVGSAITSYARNFTIRTAQKNFYGSDKAGFIYADTDSIHCDIKKEELKGVNIHPTDYSCWKIEKEWKYGWFVRAKTYIEYNDLKSICCDDIKCAGMPDNCKELFIDSLLGRRERKGEFSQEEYDFLFDKFGDKIIRRIEDFTIGLEVFGKLKPKRIKGGVVLVKSPHKIRRG